MKVVRTTQGTDQRKGLVFGQGAGQMELETPKKQRGKEVSYLSSYRTINTLAQSGPWTAVDLLP